MSDPLLDIRNLQVWYRVYGGYLKVLDGVYFSVSKGERVGLVGETGCGKTTTMKAILRILPDRDVKIPQGQIFLKATIFSVRAIQNYHKFVQRESR